MITRAIKIVGLGIAILWLTGCADRTVTLRYTPDPQIERLPSPRSVTVFRLADRRGDEGDNGDPFRVGGIYNGYGMRYAKIMTPTPWPNELAQDLAAGFMARGVQAVVVADREYAPGVPVSTPLVLSGEIHNFSTEARWLGLLAHVSGIIRLYDEQGHLLLEKPASARVRPTDQASYLEDLLNEALRQFVRRVVTDPDLSQRLAMPR